MTTVSISNVLHLSTLYEAWDKVNTNGGMGGVDGVSLQDFENNLQSHLETLQNEVNYDTYRPLPLLRIYIDKPSGGKRPLSIPAIRDRVLQTAVAQLLNPLFEAEFEEVSFAYRRGRSVAQAISLVERLRNKGYHWVVEVDIRRYFDEVDHQLLMAEVKKLVHDTAILGLIQRWLKATIVDKKQRFKLEKGIPQGSPLSPLLANLYLDHLDETLLDNNYQLVRYADDFVVLCKTAEKAEQALELTNETLESLRLALNQQKTRIVDFDQGFRFLGVQFIRSLAIKSKQPARRQTVTTADDEPQTRRSASVTPNRRKPQKKPDITQWYSYALSDGSEYTSTDEMREAFAEAGISPNLFNPEPAHEDLAPPAKTPLAVQAVEPQPLEPQPLEPQPLEPQPLEPQPLEPQPTKPQSAEHLATDLATTDRDKSTPPSQDPHLKTLYLMEHDTVLGKQYERFTVKRQGNIIKEIPAIHVDQIMVYGNAQLTTQVMQYCLQQRIPIYLLSGKGRYFGMVDSFSTDPVLLHREQFLKADDSNFCIALAKQFITGKIANTRLLLTRFSRNRDAPAFEQASDKLNAINQKTETASSLDQLRGYEGSAARHYFQAIAATLDPEWLFNGRNKQPPTDPVNAMLSYGYTLLFYNCYSLLRARGLNPHVGYLHPMRMGHPALASDVMEEFRAIIVDAVVLNLIFNNKVTPEDFDLPENPGEACLLKPSARNLFISQLESKLNSAIQHPISKLKLDYRRCMEHQINHLVAVIRDKEPHYQPMILR